MQFLRKNTAVIVTVGPFYDKTDGVTLETALTITNERITLTADTDDGSAPTLILDNITGATSATSNDLNYITGNDSALMQLELAAANVNRLGRMTLTITDAANHVPVVHDYMVVNAALYDAFFATSGGAIPNVAADAAGGLPISDAGGLDLDAKIGALTFTAANKVDANALAIANGTIVAATFGAGAIDAAAIADNAIDAGAIAANAITAAKIADGAIDAATFAAGAIDAAAIADSALDALTFTAVICTGTVGSGSTTTSIVCSAITPASTVNDQFVGRIIIFDRATTTAALRGQATDITAWVHATTTATVTALTTAPVSGDTFHVL